MLRVALRALAWAGVMGVRGGPPDGVEEALAFLDVALDPGLVREDLAVMDRGLSVEASGRPH